MNQMAKTKKPGSGSKRNKASESSQSSISANDTNAPEILPQAHLRQPAQSRLLKSTNSRAASAFSQLINDIGSTSSLPPPGLQPKVIDETNLTERKDELVSQMLERFTKLVGLASQGKNRRADDGSAASREVALAQGLAMEVESAALVKAAEDLLLLTRKLKEMWLFGALRQIGEGEGEGKIDEDSIKVGEMIEKILRNDAEDANSKLMA